MMGRKKSRLERKSIHHFLFISRTISATLRETDRDRRRLGMGKPGGFRSGNVCILFFYKGQLIRDTSPIFGKSKGQGLVKVKS